MSNLMKTLTIGDASYEICDASAVKSVNGVIPDENGNVVVQAGGASSWNDLEDKPFYEDVTEVVMLDNVTMDCSSSPIFQMSGFAYEFTEGNTYTVTVNGTEYSCVAYMISADGMAIPVVGNATLAEMTGGNGEPFLAYALSGTFVCMHSATGTYTVSIAGSVSTVHELDEKFIPYIAGKNVSGQTFTIDGEEVVAGTYAETFNVGNIATGMASHAEGYYTVASGLGSHAEGGFNTIASGYASHAEGDQTTASGDISHAEGEETTASGSSSHAEGRETTASGDASHAEGSYTTASGSSSHAEGTYTTASGYNGSHAEGYNTTASGNNASHAEGFYTIAASDYQHAQGKYNIEDSADKYAHIVGNGTSDTARSNAHTLDWDGNAWFAGDVYVGSTSGTDKDDGSVKLAKLTDIPKATAVADVTGETVTAAEFNALLAALRNAGLMAT